MTTEQTAPSEAPKSKGLGLAKTRKRALARRGVMWLGQTCNLRCYFCYFVNRIADPKHPEHAFMGLEKAKAICYTLRRFYGDTAIDIQGGEPTIYPHILELTRYCHEIGLYPTLITNGLALAKPGAVEAYKEACVRDFLVSFHGIGEVHDKVVGRPGAYRKLIAAVEQMQALDMPVRFNCTMSEPVVPLLPEIARKAIAYGAYAVNYIAFNPFGDQTTGHRTSENVARYSDINVALTEAIDLLEAAGVEVNVRYLPLCIAEPRHRKNFYNYQQLPYDTHEWNYASWLWTMMAQQMGRPDIGPSPTPRLGCGARKIAHPDDTLLSRLFLVRKPGITRLIYAAQHVAARLDAAFSGLDRLYRDEARLRAARDCHYQYHSVCEECAAKAICDGFHGDYAEFFGTGEARPIQDIETTDDPRFFIREQEKFVEDADRAWAL